MLVWQSSFISFNLITLKDSFEIPVSCIDITGFLKRTSDFLLGYIKRKRKELKEALDNAQKKCLDEEQRKYTIVIHSDAESRPHENGKHYFSEGAVTHAFIIFS